MRVLGIETSCDETGVAVYDSEQGLLGHALYSQVHLHQRYGGVLPELASRDHIQKLTPLIDNLFEELSISWRNIDGIAYTAGPGLIGALLVGATFAKSLAYALKLPAIAVHHMEGHLLAPMLEANPPSFPFVALLVSGGHTQLIRVNDFRDYILLGESVDDAAGEAFDKTAKLLGLPYPGGPELANLALQGDSQRFTFPRPMTDRPGLDFSFSGLKTFALTTYRKHQHCSRAKADIARAFEDAVVDTLVIKCRRALAHTGLSTLVVAGGVSANQRLRAALDLLVDKLKGEVFFPRKEFCTDNGAMIAYAGCLRLLKGECDDSMAVQVMPRWPMMKKN